MNAYKYINSSYYHITVNLTLTEYRIQPLALCVAQLTANVDQSSDLSLTKFPQALAP